MCHAEPGGSLFRHAPGRWLDTRLDTVEAFRRGDTAAVRRQDMPTLNGLVDEYLGQHVAEANTIATRPARAQDTPQREGTPTVGDDLRD
jgi:hypothetical protein